MAVPTALAAEGERVFDPELSLTGDCSTSAIDEVPDPGLCPIPPGVAGVDHPLEKFDDPRAVATDFHGNIYVGVFGKNDEGTQGRIDIFDPSGLFIEEIVLDAPFNFGPMSLAVDSQGVLYAGVFISPGKEILRYTPCAPYEPEAGNIEYCSDPVAFAPDPGQRPSALAINADNDHLFVNSRGDGVTEYTSAAEGNVKVRTALARGVGVAVDDSRGRLYASFEPGGLEIRRIDIFDLTSVVGPPPGEYEKVDTIEESALPGEDIGNFISLAVDENTGHLFAHDTENKKLYEFTADGEFVTEIKIQGGFDGEIGAQIGVDNGSTSLSKGNLYVPSHKTGTGHSFAFEEVTEDEPEVKAPEATNVSETEAELVAKVNPRNLETTYTLHYITAQLAAQNEEEAKDPFEGATLAGEGTLPAGNLDLEVSAALTGLEAGRSYRFRVFAENSLGDDEAQAGFATYPSFPVEPPEFCPNPLLRTGLSALLPDCRAYELVTPPDTNGRAPIGTTREINSFTIRQVSPGGEAVPFKVEGGSIPGFPGTGSFLGDPYLSTRTEAGWQTTYIGPTGAEAKSVIAGTGSPDQGHSFWVAEVAGTAVVGGEPTNYVRFPDGHSELIGQGSLGTDPRAVGRLISGGGGHIVFTSGGNTPAIQLEPTAAPDGTIAIYDRVPGPEAGERETKVVSLLPGEVPLGAGEDAFYMGASLDGELVAFKVGTTLYLRYQNEETFEIGEGITYAGLAEGGGRILYVDEDGDLKAFDASSEEVIEFSETGDAVPVFLAQGGSAAYFVSETAISGSGPNPEGDEPQAAAQNLYLSEEGQVSFVATLTDRDVEGEVLSGIETVDGLGLWVDAANPQFPGRFGKVPARASADGSVLLFKSRAQLSDYDPAEKAQIYRYDSAAGELWCLSCNPTGAPPNEDATLQTERREENIPLSFSQAWIENLRADGQRAFFESSEPLVGGDSDGFKDVYEWEAEGVGSCAPPAPEGCLYLISSPQSLRNEFLWAVSPTGEDVFFFSAELLTGSDVDATPSIYDARVGGGFAEAVKEECAGEGCRPGMSPPPAPFAVQTLALGAKPSPKPKRCGKGKRKVKRAGKVICVKKHKPRQRRAQGGRR
ncbi:MAG TPA: hypothetical protein VFM51_03635 [Solirubrobacterales bacterium]|nr:hypothetical protein [Solirubrobacterales bacterium]